MDLRAANGVALRFHAARATTSGASKWLRKANSTRCSTSPHEQRARGLAGSTIGAGRTPEIVVGRSDELGTASAAIDQAG